LRAESANGDEHELRALLSAARAVLPAGATVHAARIGSAPALLTPEEERHVAGAVPKRRREFAAGRACARAALAALGVPARSIPAGPAREPVWPAGVVGSLSHDGDFCVAAVHTRPAVPGLGIDLADAAPLDGALLPRICTPDEARALERASRSPPCDGGKLVFCIKEAAYKCLFPLVREVFGFHDVAAELDLADGAARLQLTNDALFARLDVRLACRFRVAAGHVLAGVWIEPFGRRLAA
jgi:4'-phosphopantetheinyl transferase EntD